MSKLTFRPVFRWEGPVEDFIRSRCSGRSLNIPCGKSPIGDVRIDSEPLNGNEIGDMMKIPYPCGSFDTVISDPPWHIAYFKRMKAFFECVYVCKVGGRIIYNATWIPESKAVVLEEIYVRQSSSFANISLLMVFKKTTSDLDSRREES